MKIRALFLAGIFVVPAAPGLAQNETMPVDNQFDLSGTYECISVNHKSPSEDHTNKDLMLTLIEDGGRDFQSYDISWAYTVQGKKVSAKAVGLLQNETLSLTYTLNFSSAKTINGVEVMRFNKMGEDWFIHGKWLRNDGTYNTGSIACVLLSTTSK
ncbi:hypothetical protein PsAD2_02915 [Pseudovibrio axinellae]|uniref:Uncharacterized protein n=1 Tax=Pseudovibrio axinellae TaxID=989403 RepID=A0A165XKM2_9HYPH|nr:hypothetical protein [Pseudovibrio axinellae]KZL17797.1 hypothetical protein PsAD2_02915 [Pseudovibrio axinellae]SEP72146.1 hypothetical protein SAMN05421798_101235 [Pseudovibrio axinellae]